MASRSASRAWATPLRPVSIVFLSSLHALGFGGSIRASCCFMVSSMSRGCDTQTVDTAPFLGLEPGRDRLHWRLPVVQALSTGGGFMFGGVGLGAAVAALEGSTGRSLAWATAQYLSFAKPPDVLDLQVTIAAEGNQTTQARVVASAGDREILTVNGALGSRAFDGGGQWAERPVVPDPDDC